MTDQEIQAAAEKFMNKAKKRVINRERRLFTRMVSASNLYAKECEDFRNGMSSLDAVITTFREMCSTERKWSNLHSKYPYGFFWALTYNQDKLEA